MPPHPIPFLARPIANRAHAVPVAVLPLAVPLLSTRLREDPSPTPLAFNPFTFIRIILEDVVPRVVLLPRLHVLLPFRTVDVGAKPVHPIRYPFPIIGIFRLEPLALALAVPQSVTKVPRVLRPPIIMRALPVEFILEVLAVVIRTVGPRFFT